MKKTLAVAAIAALAGVAGAANAADMYSPAGGMKDTYVAPVTTWTGFYIGAHVGGFWADIKDGDNGYYDSYYNDNWNNNPVNYGWNNNNSGVFGGGTVGYNYQSGAFVFGVEADFGGAGLTGNWNDGVASGKYGNMWAKDDGSFYADVTGRLGFAAGPALFYVKGGWAYLDDNASFGGYGSSLGGVTGRRRIRMASMDGSSAAVSNICGAQIGASRLNTCISISAGNNFSWTDYCSKTWNFNHDLSVNSFKVGLNYHFNTVYAPLK